MISMSQTTVFIAGALAGFTIYLGLPVALFRLSPRVKVFLSATSVGILLFLFVEIVYQVVEKIESSLKLSFLGYRSSMDLLLLTGLFVLSFTAALFCLLAFETKLRGSEENRSPLRLAFMIAVGIGLHNFSEGLVIGQQFAGGALSLGLLLVIGFALHNATEGFGIAAPLASEKVSWPTFFSLGLIGGGPTFLGTIIGTRWKSETAEVLFLSLAAGAILYIIGELIHLGRRRGGHWIANLGLLAGFFLAFSSDLIIERATTVGFLEKAEEKAVAMQVGDYFFEPRELHLAAGRPVKLLIENRGSVEHEIEFLGMGEEMEQVIPWQGRGAVLLYPRFSGTYPFICDMPGHLARGMRGTLVVH